MITPDQVPEDAWVELALRLESCGFDVSERVARLAVVAAINAWSDMRAESRAVCDVIVLPIREKRG